MKAIGGNAIWIVIVSGLTAASVWTWWRFNSDMQQALDRVANGSVLVETSCGLIEYQELGAGVPMLAVHGSGGGFDQGMAFAGPLASQGIRVIAMSRFGYLRTPMPADGSATAQADAHVCLLDALGIPKAAVMGGSAGGPSALQMALRHPDRTLALVLLVPLAYRPPTQADSAPPLPPWVEATMMRLIGSDFLFWSALHLARDQVIKLVLATPPELLAHASQQERARIDAMLDNILPISLRAEGLRSDSNMGKHLAPSPLEAVRAPTLVISARDDRYGTYASAQYTAGEIAGAKFIGFDAGGHTWVGHDDEVRGGETRSTASLLATREQFLVVFIACSGALWPFQVLADLPGLLMVVLIIRPSAQRSRLIAAGTTFTVWLFLPTRQPMARRLLVIPVVWPLIGGNATFLLATPQDWPLRVSGLTMPALLKRDAEHRRDGSERRMERRLSAGVRPESP